MSSKKSPSDQRLNAEVVQRARAQIDLALKNFLSPSKGPKATVVTAPAGAGKSILISQAAGLSRKEKLRVVIGAPTNEQAFGLVRSVARENPGLPICYLPASSVTPPDWMDSLRTVQIERDASTAGQRPLLIATLSKLGDAFSRGSISGYDALLIDESYQADSAKYFATAGLAERHLLVGDGGQINPFSTMDDPTRWRGLAEDPLQTAVGLIRRNYPNTPVFGMPITRRLDPRGARIAQVFYPNLKFDAAVLPGVRKLELRAKSTRDKKLISLDAALDLASHEGWAYLTLPQEVVLSADPESVDAIVALVRRLLERKPSVTCERDDRKPGRPLAPDQIAIGTSHNDQKDLLRAALDRAGLNDVVVDTANKLQGLEYEVAIMWHPLAGVPEADEFHLDPGRLCVMLTRHRQACIVVGRAGDSDLVRGVPPSTPGFLGYDPDPVLDGWEIHNAVFAQLEKFRIAFGGN